MVRSRYHSEFGGGTGRIAPQPHDFSETTGEMRRMVYNTDSTDSVDTPEAALAREFAEEGRTGTESEIR